MLDLEEGGSKVDDLAERFHCMTLHKRDTPKRGKAKNSILFLQKFDELD